MKSEKIIKCWRICYMLLFDDNGNEAKDRFTFYQDKKAVYDCRKIFWRFYWIYDIHYL